jgi:hypothetical protein
MVPAYFDPVIISVPLLPHFDHSYDEAGGQINKTGNEANKNNGKRRIFDR